MEEDCVQQQSSKLLDEWADKTMEEATEARLADEMMVDEFVEAFLAQQTAT